MTDRNSDPVEQLGRSFRDIRPEDLTTRRFLDLTRGSANYNRIYRVLDVLNGQEPTRVIIRYTDNPQSRTLLASQCAFDREIVPTPVFEEPSEDSGLVAAAESAAQLSSA